MAGVCEGQDEGLTERYGEVILGGMKGPPKERKNRGTITTSGPSLEQQHITKSLSTTNSQEPRGTLKSKFKATDKKHHTKLYNEPPQWHEQIRRRRGHQIAHTHPTPQPSPNSDSDSCTTLTLPPPPFIIAHNTSELGAYPDQTAQFSPKIRIRSSSIVAFVQRNQARRVTKSRARQVRARHKEQGRDDDTGETGIATQRRREKRVVDTERAVLKVRASRAHCGRTMKSIECIGRCSRNGNEPVTNGRRGSRALPGMKGVTRARWVPPCQSSKTSEDDEQVIERHTSLLIRPDANPSLRLFQLFQPHIPLIPRNPTLNSSVPLPSCFSFNGEVVRSTFVQRNFRNRR
ncbi:hypothetical protein DFP72DRAFT_1054004 [Ephemerocybe angulata]|uniref:Uncharacterized protein n=1 Tax=Ephemerocybe angulata TaxID=980116 RepID=A0A8H6HAB5_9AGAR|nr:hypothetical protein DFP72DRAFT_1054004 [Tulosesus angulatus]